MKVNFNNLRLRLLKTHDRLTKILNDAIVPQGQTITVDGPTGNIEHNMNGGVVLDVCDLEDVLNDLRTYIGGVAMVYQEGDPDFINVFEQHYPGEKVMGIFNPEPNEE